MPCSCPIPLYVSTTSTFLRWWCVFCQSYRSYSRDFRLGVCVPSSWSLRSWSRKLFFSGGWQRSAVEASLDNLNESFLNTNWHLFSHICICLERVLLPQAMNNPRFWTGDEAKKVLFSSACTNMGWWLRTASKMFVCRKTGFGRNGIQTKSSPEGSGFGFPRDCFFFGFYHIGTQKCSKFVVIWRSKCRYSLRF